MNLVYAITNGAGRQYVGSTRNPVYRIAKHKRQLRAGDHHCKALQEAWNAHGAGAFEFVKLVECDTLEEAREIEQALLDCFKPSLFNTYSSVKGMALGDTMPGTKKPEHWRKWRSEFLAEKWADPAYRAKASENMRGPRAVVTCPHCGKEGGGGNMRRYHFDSCKARKLVS